MTAPQPVPANAPLVGLRLHPAVGPGAAAGRTRELLDLKDREAQRTAALQALQQLATTARATVAAVPAQVATRLDEVAALAVELGLAVARELVGHALAKGHVDPTPTVVRCLRDCVHGASDADLVVRLHPDDVAAVETALQGMSELRDEIAVARFVGDPAVPRGGVCAETGAGRLRYDPRDVLERICAEIRREAAP
jgi:flagellar biosynthesis/type III secretory pathway protein FliH